MSTATLNRTAEYLKAIEGLPDGAYLRLTDVTWEEYEELGDEIGESRPSVRLAYDNGVLEIMTVTRKHEAIKSFAGMMARALAEEMDIEMEECGSTTYKEEKAGKGVDPDECFYVVNPASVIGKDKVEWGVDPPPDIAVEIDVTNPSKMKLGIYAHYGVPEIWLFKGVNARLLRLTERGYEDATHSQFFPLLSAEALTRFTALSREAGQSKALKAFRSWVREQAK
jgi:Uma2 family endonuclease